MVQNLDPNMTWPCPRCKVPQVVTAMYCANCAQPLGAAPPGPPVVMPVPQPAAPAKPAAGLSIRNPGLALAAILIAGGSFLPWGSVTTGFGTVSRSGMDGGDEIITLIVAIVLLVLATAHNRWTAVIGGLLLSGVAAWVLYTDGIALSRNSDIDIGAGIWTIGVGVLVGILASLAAK